MSTTSTVPAVIADAEITPPQKATKGNKGGKDDRVDSKPSDPKKHTDPKKKRKRSPTPTVHYSPKQNESEKEKKPPKDGKKPDPKKKTTAAKTAARKKTKTTAPVDPKAEQTNTWSNHGSSCESCIDQIQNGLRCQRRGHLHHRLPSLLPQVKQAATKRNHQKMKTREKKWLTLKLPQCQSSESPWIKLGRSRQTTRGIWDFHGLLKVFWLQNKVGPCIPYLFLQDF